MRSRLRARACVALTTLLCASAVGLSAQGAGTSRPDDNPPDRAERQTPQEDHQSHDQPLGAGLLVRAFGSLNWATTTEKTVPNSFALGQFALFATSTLSDRFSVLAEVVLEGSSTPEVVTDLERLQMTFRLNDLLHVSAGRYHTAIGYYNTAYHHGAFFETTTGRPRVYEFEDDGGVLPVHEVGISAGGAVPGTGGALQYVAEVGNGRFWGTNSEGISETPDTNDAKSTNVALAFRPGRWRGLELGTSFYRDQIPVDDPGPSPIDHRIVTAYGVYKTPSFEFMAEWLQLKHITPDGTKFVNHAGYVQVSKAFGRLRPYYRYDRQVINPDTPLIGPQGFYDQNLAGLRWDAGQWVGLKVQYERTNESSQRGIDTLRTQLVFVF